jgi:hypothetical protein
MIFSFEQNRSERAVQTAYLAPALANVMTRRRLLSLIRLKDGTSITPEESDKAVVMHFVWVLRDMFSAERESTERSRDWATLRERWRLILGLQEWARDSKWWRHPSGSYKEDSEYAVHPCSRSIGWTEQVLVKRFGLEAENKTRIQTLVLKRELMNTECDCFIQTPERLIVVECKDRTSFLSEQEGRQRDLFPCIERALPRSNSLEYVEIASKPIGSRPRQYWSWDMIK